MSANYQHLKDRQRKERETHPESAALRIHRALSWLHRAEQCEDLDGRFVFLWIAFNAAYSNDLGNLSISESDVFNSFLKRLMDLDADKKLYRIVWQQYTNAIRVLLDNQYVYQPFWNHHNRVKGYDDWQEGFNRSKKLAHNALAANDTAKVLSIIFSRLYTLRNQLVHGGATFNSSANRDQMRDACSILGEIVPTIIEIMLDNATAHWGDACYPVVR